MDRSVLILVLSLWFAAISCMEEPVQDTNYTTPSESINSTDPNKDMYVIHAMVYQVGILTNKTDNSTYNTTGTQEAVTFFHNNGSLDLSKIGNPLQTNVTAQSMVGVAPVGQDSMNNTLPWSTLGHLTNMPQTPLPIDSEQRNSPHRAIREISPNFVPETDSLDNFYKSLFKRDTGDTPVAIRTGSAVIPESAGVHSIALAPLLSLNNNMSDIPVPIPNTSVVHYAKINTLVTKP